MSAYAMRDTDLLALAGRQHGVVSDDQARELGYSTRMIGRRVQSGAWLRMLPGVLRCTGAPATDHQMAMAAALWAGSGAVVSHTTAGVLWRLDGVVQRGLEVTLPPNRDRRSSLVTVHRTVELSTLDRAVVVRVPVTSPTRTLIDLAGALAPDQLELAAEDAFRRRLSSPRRLGARLAQLEGRGRSGSGRLRMLLEERGARAVTGSAPEVRLERLLVRNGLPRPARQYAVAYGGRTIHVYADLAPRSSGESGRQATGYSQ